ncbi:hypothetical protein IGS68_00810 [Skermanella sp. TT6]|uniref:Uncharacterized protein n=1 Tax=Skermanella cutis TaxID=2775420 RepID=A0ABX7B7X3_9PROT|nr:hypothetical protein [Skermanella sp. TT6]QQP89855.1 hypothetical protein IGS68_00810 [Skermanella sp. TT6]
MTTDAGRDGMRDTESAPRTPEIAGDVILRLGGEVPEPVTLIRTLSGWGLGLRAAHETVGRLSPGETVPLGLTGAPARDDQRRILNGPGIGASFPEASAGPGGNTP